MSILPFINWLDLFTQTFLKCFNWEILEVKMVENCWVINFTRHDTLQSILQEISPGISLEGMMLKLKLQYFGHLMQRVDSLKKTHAGRDWGQEGKGTTEDEMAGWHHQLDGREFEWTPGVGDGQGGLACCDFHGVTNSQTRLSDWTELNWWILLYVYLRRQIKKTIATAYIKVFCLCSLLGVLWFQDLHLGL